MCESEFFTFLNIKYELFLKQTLSNVNVWNETINQYFNFMSVHIEVILDPPPPPKKKKKKEETFCTALYPASSR